MPRLPQLSSEEVEFLPVTQWWVVENLIVINKVVVKAKLIVIIINYFIKLQLPITAVT